jgi:hypothetical protein
MPKSKPLPPLAELSARLSYDPQAGIFTWKVEPRRGMKAGAIAGCIDSNGYVQIRHNKKIIFAHRLAWLFFYGEDPGDKDIDHVNQNRSDNRITNLRLADRAENMWNRGACVTNKSGYKGVCWSNSNGWFAQVKRRGEYHSASGFATAEAAYQWTCAVREALHGEFVSHGDL